jgi:hypothetical protein
MATERDTAFSNGQLHQFPGEGLTDVADLLKEFYSLHSLFTLVLSCQNVML